jgi:hypothetical protein
MDTSWNPQCEEPIRVRWTDGDPTFQADLGWRRLSVAPRAGGWIETHLDAKM